MDQDGPSSPTRPKRKCSLSPEKAKRQQALVLCPSGIYNEQLKALEQSCAQLGARLVTEWSDDVTHLVMDKIAWSPKLLSAMAGLRPVVSTKWVQRAAEGSPLPDVADPELAPQSTGHSTDGVATVRPERARLFHGKRYICLPGAPADTQTLLVKMGADVLPWPGAVEGDYYDAQRVQGLGFLLAGDAFVSRSAERAHTAVERFGAFDAPVQGMEAFVDLSVSDTVNAVQDFQNCGG